MQHASNRKQIRLHILERQLGRLERKIRQLRRVSERYTKSRIIIVLIGLSGSIVSAQLGGEGLGWSVLTVVAVLFGVVAYYHHLVKTSISKHEIGLHIKSSQVARMKLDWKHIPSISPTSEHSDHPFEIDLDITGSHSLHQLLDVSISQNGSQRLRDWLLATIPDPQLIGKRQALVQELIPLFLFRDKLLLYSAMTSKDSNEKWDGKKLLDWLQQHPVTPSLRSTLIVLVFLAVANIAILILTNLAILPKFWRISYFIYFGILFVKQKEIKDAFGEALSLEGTLRKLKVVFQHLETYRYGKSPTVAGLCAPFLDKQNRPSLQLKRISRVASALSLRSNPLVWLLVHLIMPWDIYFIHRLYRYKIKTTELWPVWLNIVFELEALNALANFAYLNPDYAFPEIISDKGPRVHPAGTLFAASLSGQGEPMTLRTEGLGHPLILDQQKVCNDFSLSEQSRIAIITGSNMSGKSSFLRTLGINLCLAYAGGPVNARNFQTALFRIFTCMRVNDSLTDGFSYFYAEVQRLKALLTATEKERSFPVFFLIDEIFRGTNNRERLIGSRSYIQALAERRTVGAIATHDLELVKLADEISRIVNYHFKEEVRNGRMSFDYTLRSGPCPTTNALKIMQMEGLPVRIEER
jgi:hypothetical protein